MPRVFKIRRLLRLGADQSDRNGDGRMKLAGGMGHLTYSTLVHPADTWEQLWDSVNRYLPAVKKRVSPNAPFGVCLRLSPDSAFRLTREPGEMQKLKAFLANNDMYVFTANAFPYGAFKGERVKEQVYEPDWRTDERGAYTMRVADVLAALAPPDISPSIQSPPLGYKPRVTGPDVVSSYTTQLLHVVAYLMDLERRTGRTVTVALEPEPSCYLELTSELITYFEDHLYTEESAKALAGQIGVSHAEAEAALRKHLGAVFDICHQAVEYEDVAKSLDDLRRAGVPIFKFQPASALRIPTVTKEIVAALEAFEDPIYLHQTIERFDGRTVQYLDLPAALAAWRQDPKDCEWRIHFHVPVFLEDVSLFKTTRPSIEDALRVHKANPVSSHIEIETYTWDVLPEKLKTGDIVDYVSRELEWLRDQLA
jgi:hypothetical protein